MSVVILTYTHEYTEYLPTVCRRETLSGSELKMLKWQILVILPVLEKSQRGSYTILPKSGFNVVIST